MGFLRRPHTMKTTLYLSILLATVSADADASAQPLTKEHGGPVRPFGGFGGQNDAGSFSAILPNLGLLHVNYRGNYDKGFGYIADFVYDGTSANPEALPAGVAGTPAETGQCPRT